MFAQSVEANEHGPRASAGSEYRSRLSSLPASNHEHSPSILRTSDHLAALRKICEKHLWTNSMQSITEHSSAQNDPSKYI